MFVWHTTVKLHDTDAAGLLFYGHQFKMAHDCYEAMLESIGFPMSWWIQEADAFLPIVHAEAEKLAFQVYDEPAPEQKDQLIICEVGRAHIKRKGLSSLQPVKSVQVEERSRSQDIMVGKLNACHYTGIRPIPKLWQECPLTLIRLLGLQLPRDSGREKIIEALHGREKICDVLLIVHILGISHRPWCRQHQEDCNPKDIPPRVSREGSE